LYDKNPNSLEKAKYKRLNGANSSKYPLKRKYTRDESGIYTRKKVENIYLSYKYYPSRAFI